MVSGDVVGRARHGMARSVARVAHAEGRDLGRHTDAGGRPAKGNHHRRNQRPGR
jgi:hypothetical protein